MAKKPSYIDLAGESSPGGKSPRIDSIAEILKKENEDKRVRGNGFLILDCIF